MQFYKHTILFLLRVSVALVCYPFHFKCLYNTDNITILHKKWTFVCPLVNKKVRIVLSILNFPVTKYDFKDIESL